MKVSKEKRGQVVIVTVEGQIDIDSSPKLREVFIRCISDKDKKILVDCLKLTYIDSSGLATLIELLQRLRKIEGELKICNLSEKVKSIFEVTKLDELFSIYPTLDKALEGFE